MRTTSQIIVATDAWRAAFPGAVVGALALRGVRNPEHSPALEPAKRELERELRSGDDAAGEATLGAYGTYYRRHGKTYHVRAQRESVARRGKPIPSRAALVEAMFMAELRNLILTAGHDLAALDLPLRADVTRDGDRYVLMSDKEAAVRAGDMMMADARGIVSSVLAGPDRRTRITRETRDVLFAVYAPAGIGEAAVRAHLEDLRATVLLVAPAARTEGLITLSTAGAERGSACRGA